MPIGRLQQSVNRRERAMATRRERSGASRRPDSDPEPSRWVVAHRVHPQGEEGLRWVFLTFARDSYDAPPASKPPA